MKRYWRVFLPVLVLVIGTVVISCSGPIAMSEATMCAGLDGTMRPVNPTSSFNAGTSEINVSAKIANAPRGTEIRAELYYVKGQENTINKLVSGTRATVEGTTYVGFTFTRGTLKTWPIGEYRVDIYIKSDKTLDLFFKTTN